MIDFSEWHKQTGITDSFRTPNQNSVTNTLIKGKKEKTRILGGI